MQSPLAPAESALAPADLGVSIAGTVSAPAAVGGSPVAGSAPLPVVAAAPIAVGAPAGMSAAGVGQAGAGAAVPTAGTVAAASGAPTSSLLPAGASAPAAVGLQCPKEACEPLPALPADAEAMGFKLTSCCTVGGDCGISRNDMECQMIPDSDPQCPMLLVEGWKIPSCCTTTGKCGLNGGMTYGCTSLEDASATLGALVELPMPRACVAAK